MSDPIATLETLYITTLPLPSDGVSLCRQRLLITGRTIQSLREVLLSTHPDHAAAT
jgi:hypothetical protein